MALRALIEMAVVQFCPSGELPTELLARLASIMILARGERTETLSLRW